MKTLVTEREARLTYLKRQLVKHVIPSRYFFQKKYIYDPPSRKISPRVRELLKEIKELEKILSLDKVK